MAQIVWHLLSNRWNSAITEYALSLSLALQQHSSYQEVFTPLAGSPAESRAQILKLKTSSLSGFSLANICHFRALARRIKPTLIIAYGGPEASLCRFLPGSQPYRIIRFRGIPLSQRFKQLPFLFTLGHAHLQALIAPNRGITAQLQALSHSLPVSCLPLGMSSDIFKYYDAHPRRPELLLVGRFDPVKGHGEFLKLFAESLRTWRFFVRPVLHLVGEPANISSEEIRRLIAENGLTIGGEVLLSDFRLRNLPQLMSTATLGVISSLGSEYICRVAEEFLLCGTPLFLSGAGATKEVLFANAGSCYAGKSCAEATKLLEQDFIKAWQETTEERREREQSAQKLYSLAAMAKSFLEALSPSSS